jgi:hypothetical protein
MTPKKRMITYLDKKRRKSRCTTASTGEARRKLR